MSRRSAVVVGGGVTGLAVAHRLLVLGKGKISVTVLEAQARTGGELALHTCGVCQIFSLLSRAIDSPLHSSNLSLLLA